MPSPRERRARPRPPKPAADPLTALLEQAAAKAASPELREWLAALASGEQKVEKVRRKAA